jgi:hypothetical protein
MESGQFNIAVIDWSSMPKPKTLDHLRYTETIEMMKRGNWFCWLGKIQYSLGMASVPFPVVSRELVPKLAPAI